MDHQGEVVVMEEVTEEEEVLKPGQSGLISKTIYRLWFSLRFA